jgi:hypothetical protein
MFAVIINNGILSNLEQPGPHVANPTFTTTEIIHLQQHILADVFGSGFIVYPLKNKVIQCFFVFLPESWYVAIHRRWFDLFKIGKKY